MLSPVERWSRVLYPDGWFEARPDCVLLGWQLRRNACKIEGIARHEQRPNRSRDIEQYAQDPDHNRHSFLRTADHSIQKNEDCRFFCVKLPRASFCVKMKRSRDGSSGSSMRPRDSPKRVSCYARDYVGSPFPQFRKPQVGRSSLIKRVALYTF